MRDPFRLTVLKAIGTCLEGITPEAGCDHDLRGRVFRGREIYGEDDPIPLVSIHEVPGDGDMPMQLRDGGESVVTLNIVLQGFVDDDRLNPTDPAHRLLAEVKAALSAERMRGMGRARDILGLGGRVAELKIGGGVVSSPEFGVSSYAFFILPVVVTFTENVNFPFT